MASNNAFLPLQSAGSNLSRWMQSYLPTFAQQSPEVNTNNMRIPTDDDPYVIPKQNGMVVPGHSLDQIIQANNDAPMNQELPINKHGVDPIPLPKEIYNDPELKGTGIVGQYHPSENTISYRDDIAAFKNPLSNASLTKMHEWRHWRQANDAEKEGISKPFSAMNDYVKPVDKESFKRYLKQPIEKDARQAEYTYANQLSGTNADTRNLLQKYKSWAVRPWGE